MITQGDVDFYQENGYLLLKNVFNPQEVKEMQDAVERIVSKAAVAKMDHNAAWPGDYIPADELKKLVLKGFHDVHYHESAFTRAVCHPNMAAALSQIIGPNVRLHHSKMLVKPPENGAAFPLHQDYPYFPHTQHSMLAASVHLDDADLENGCLRVIPKSHKLGALPHVGLYYLNHKEYPIASAEPCPAKAGDVLFFNYLTIHGSEANRSARPRRNVLFQYRDPSDLPIENVHVNWGQGLMISGENPVFREYRPD